MYAGNRLRGTQWPWRKSWFQFRVFNFKMLIINCILFPLVHLYRHLLPRIILSRQVLRIRRLPRPYSFNKLPQRRLQAQLRPLPALLWTLVQYINIRPAVSKIVFGLLSFIWHILLPYHLIQWLLVMVISQFIHFPFLIHEILHQRACPRVLPWRQRAHNVFLGNLFRSLALPCHIINGLLMIVYHVVLIQYICDFLILQTIFHHVITGIHSDVYLLAAFWILSNAFALVSARVLFFEIVSWIGEVDGVLIQVVL